MSITEAGRSPPKAEAERSVGRRAAEGCDQPPGRSAKKEKGERVHFTPLL